MGKEGFYQVEKKVIINLVRKIVKEVETVHSVKTSLLGKNIRIKQNSEGMDIWLGLIVKRKTSIPATVEEVQKKIKQEIEKTLGTVVRKVDIVVKGIKFSS